MNEKKRDLVVLPLLPVFGGESSQAERIQNAFEIISKADQIPKEDIDKIEAAIYAAKEMPPHIRSAAGRVCPL